MARRKEKVCLCISIPIICIIIIIIICATHFNEECADGLYKNAAVAADSETCSKIGRDILQLGGSAVDGAIATLLCTSIINPQSMGIGGGSIFTIREQSGKVRVINARETVPKAFKTDLLAMCPTTTQPMEGAHWIGVPGDIRGYERAHKLYGRLPWASLFEPTIKMAREGVPVPYEAVEIIQKHFADKVRAKISPDRTYDASYYNITPYLDSHGTTHVSVLAEDGMAVSVTSTINHIFGSRIFSPKTGILLNNELADFCGKTDQIHAGEQPPSSMSPVILYSPSQKHIVVIGASGGSMITTGVALTLMNFLWFGKTLQDSISAPVVFVDSKNILNFEPLFDKIVLESLYKIGHKVKVPQMFYNVVNAVSKENNCIVAVSDSRKNGKAAGY
uniref:Gamma-glutamyltransferase 5-like n=1 Tax=Sinocyclocheilus grahami TaxID=75366 RepID=A0A672MWF7_SINGR